jgi:hypothetical protein
MWLTSQLSYLVALIALLNSSNVDLTLFEEEFMVEGNHIRYQ